MLNRLEMLRIFCTAAEARNFKEAAQQLGISPQVVTRAIQELESQFGELLFHRNTRQCRITREGERLAHIARQGVEGIDCLFRGAEANAAQQVEGTVRLTAPEAIGQTSLVHSLARLRQQYPGLHFELHLEDDETDVVDEQIDIGIRHGLIRDSRFVARQVAEVPFYMVAAPGLLARCGVPRTLKDVQQQPVVGTIDQRTGKPWPWFFRQESQWIPRELAFISNSTQAECAAVLAGFGFAQMPGFVAIPHLRSGELVEVLPELAPTPWALSVYRPQRSPVPARVRVVYDWLVSDFSNPAFFPLLP
ncbi:LysR family transcriptional regulator [Aquitalea magnusonii]|uniref:LysR family transcriptional regulator n=1 Tax=Aquitalea pelogenes TaxID=1293573 RepID=UPI0005F7891C|nr:LysR family transcriptional regulator [Aquitalea magnusonii]